MFTLSWNTVPYAEWYCVYENTDLIFNTTSSFVVISDKSNGTYYYHIVAGNKNGTTSSEIDYVTVLIQKDITPPLIVLVSSLNLTQLPVELLFSVKDDSEILYVKYQLDGVFHNDINFEKGNYKVKIDSISEGDHTIKLSTSDIYGNVDVRNFTLHYIKPAVHTPPSIMTGGDNTIYTVLPIYITGDVMTDSVITDVRYSVDNAPWKYASGNESWLINISSLTAGKHTLKITANDDYGLSGESTLSFTYSPDITNGYDPGDGDSSTGNMSLSESEMMFLGIVSVIIVLLIIVIRRILVIRRI